MMELLLDETFKTIIMEQYNIVQHGGVGSIEVIIFSYFAFDCCCPVRELGFSPVSAIHLQGHSLLLEPTGFSQQKQQMALARGMHAPLACVLHGALGLKPGGRPTWISTRDSASEPEGSPEFGEKRSLLAQS